MVNNLENKIEMFQNIEMFHSMDGDKDERVADPYVKNLEKILRKTEKIVVATEKEKEELIK